VERLPVDDPLAPYRAVDRRPVAGRPWVLANMVAGLDGSTAVGGRVGPLSDPTDQQLFKLLRTLAGVVLVGAETVRREGYGPVSPRLAVVSRSLAFDLSRPVFAGATFVTCEASPADRRAGAARVGEVLLAGDEAVDLRSALPMLGADVVLTEGGPSLLGELVAADLLDELCLTLTPVLGGDPLPVAVVPPGSGLRRFRLGHALAHGDTLFLRYERSS
jgi:riboflavin biosynthesis pyrimidine reductase